MKVALLGAGAMGTGIGQIAATHGHDVVYYDTFPGACERSEASLAKVFARLVEKGTWSQEQREAVQDRLRWTSDLADLAGAELVIEAVVENLEVKQALFKSVEPVVAVNSTHGGAPRVALLVILFLLLFCARGRS